MVIRCIAVKDEWIMKMVLNMRWKEDFFTFYGHRWLLEQQEIFIRGYLSGPQKTDGLTCQKRSSSGLKTTMNFAVPLIGLSSIAEMLMKK